MKRIVEGLDIRNVYKPLHMVEDKEQFIDYFNYNQIHVGYYR